MGKNGVGKRGGDKLHEGDSIKFSRDRKNKKGISPEKLGERKQDAHRVEESEIKVK